MFSILLLVHLFVLAIAVQATTIVNRCTESEVTVSSGIDVRSFTLSDVEFSGMINVSCFWYKLERCGVDVTEHVLSAELEFKQNNGALLFGGAGIPVKAFQTGSLHEAYIIMGKGKYRLSFTTTSDSYPQSCSDSNIMTTLKYSLDKSITDQTGIGDDDIWLYPMVGLTDKVFFVKDDFLVTALINPSITKPWGKFAEGRTCDNDNLSQMELVTISGLKFGRQSVTPDDGGFRAFCVRNATFADAASAPVPLKLALFIVLGKNGIVSSVTCVNPDAANGETQSTCNIEIALDVPDGSQFGLVDNGGDCSAASNIKNLEEGPVPSVTVMLDGNRKATPPEVCYRPSSSDAWIKTVSASQLTQQALESARAAAQRAATLRTNGQNSGSTISSLGFGLIIGGVVLVAIVAATIAGIVYYRRRRKGFGVKLKALMLN